MKALYYDFINGLARVTVTDIIAEYEFIKENNLDFALPALAIALEAVNKRLSYTAFEAMVEKEDERLLFRAVAKLQNQVTRRLEKEEQVSLDIRTDAIAYTERKDEDDSEEFEDDNEEEEEEGE